MKFILLSLMWCLTVFAESAPGAPALSPFIPLIVIFAIFYFLVLRPQQKKAKDHQKFLSEIKRGDVVVSNSGIVGTVRTVSEKFVTLEVDEGVCLKIVRGQISESATALRDEPKAKPTLTIQEEKK